MMSADAAADIRKAAGYMPPDCVLSYIQGKYGRAITKAHVVHIIATMNPGDRHGAVLQRFKGPDERSLIGASSMLPLPPELANKIDRLIAARARDCGVTADLFKREVLRWI